VRAFGSTGKAFGQRFTNVDGDVIIVDYLFPSPTRPFP
jgi:hypothetical protein